ncbi:MAG: cytochrome P450, partial [Bacteroidota bacterium]
MRKFTLMEASLSQADPAVIPHPPRLPLIGNIHLVAGGRPVQNLMKLADQYGPLFRMYGPMGNILVLSKLKYVKDVCDESRFQKNLPLPLIELKGLGGDGLFTSWTHDDNWQKAHNILLPGLGQRAMKGYFPMMLDIVERLLAKWHNKPEGEFFNLTEDMTRLTLDTIGLCGFDYRFHSFSSEKPNEFVSNMLVALEDAMRRTNIPPFLRKFRFRKNRRYKNAENTLYEIVDQIIQERKNHPEKYLSKTDLLSLMMNAMDTASGEKLSDTNIRFQCITFLIAGHETTSGLLSLAFYFLMKHPKIMEKAYQEVDAVLGSHLDQKPTYRKVMDLRYIHQILFETLRLWPTAPAFSLYSTQDTHIGPENTRIEKGQKFIVLIPNLHRDPEVWGTKADQFNPDHFTEENMAARDPDAYKPFGNGQRACIGRQFAMLEASLALGMILQRYRMQMSPGYELKIKETLTLKPEDLMVSLKVRKAEEKYTAHPISSAEKEPSPQSQVPRHDTPLTLLYGSNMGASEDLAWQIAQDGEMLGFATQVMSLDDSIPHFPLSGMLVIVSSTYNGTPPENAHTFKAWLEKQANTKFLKQLKFTVFGCGNTQWKTFQEFPRWLDQKLEALGAQRIYPRGEADANGDFEDHFEKWYQPFWPTIRKEFAVEVESELESGKALYQLQLLDSSPPPQTLSEISPHPIFEVLENQELQAEQAPRSTRHIEFKLPAHLYYQTGDYLLVYPQNPEELLEKVAQRFQMNLNQGIQLQTESLIKSHLPVMEAILLRDLLAHYVELQDPLLKKYVPILIRYTECPPEKKRLEALQESIEKGSPLFIEEVQKKKLSLLALLLELPACEIPFEVFLEMLPPLRPRYFSISSSALSLPDQCSITVGVLEEPAYSGKGTFKGISTHYLASLKKGDQIRAQVQKNSSNFHLPDDPQRPIIMLAAGTGIAPFRGFLQERTEQQKNAQEISSAILFFGCRHPEEDFIYQTELKAYAKQGITQLYTAFSRFSEEKVYVQHRLLEHKAKVWSLL